MEKKKLYIGGQWVNSSGNDYIDVENPATRDIIAQIPAGNEEDVNRAVAAAKAAFPIWSSMSPSERSAGMRKIGEYFSLHVKEIADTITAEMGAPVCMSEDWHVVCCAEEAEEYAKIAEEYKYETSLDGVTIRREPVGVVAGITPWNFPLDQITVKMLPAIAAGNCVVVKPSQQAPLSAYYLAKAVEYASLPAGVFNLVTGRGGEVGNLLASHPDISMISFTGSTEGGQQIAKCAIDSNVKKMVLELGGKSAAVVLSGADYERAVSEVLYNCTVNTGQMCCALTRLIIPEQDKAEIEDLLKKNASQIKVGDPLDPDTDLGPVVSRKQFDNVKKYIEIGIKEGARMIAGEVPEGYENGYYIKPAVFMDVDNSMTIAQEEIFGPVLSVITYKTVDEAVRIANDSPYGLAGACYGDEKEAIAVGRRLETGSVSINGAPFVPDAPFGGYKASGIGREHGAYGFEEYLEIKSLLI